MVAVRSRLLRVGQVQQRQWQRQRAMSSGVGQSSRKVKVVLLENIHQRAVQMFENRNFIVESHPKALSGQELLDVAGDAHILGIRSKTQLTEEFFDTIGSHAHRLWAVGCFCIGTNQVDLAAAAAKGVTVFNAPFSNTRSVAEKTLCETIALQRRLFVASTSMHQGKWAKTADGCHEVRGKTLGIVGYGRIGSQVSVLAEGLGLNVIFYDGKKALSLGNAVECASLEELLQKADIVTLHVPETPRTRNMITTREIKQMKPGAQLINNARGDVVDLVALSDALKSGHLSGAAIDVYPEEPESNGAFSTEQFGVSASLAGLDNVILTPHVGGSTSEAQQNIAEEVSEKLVTLLSQGSTTMSVNCPEVELGPAAGDLHRLLHFHRNVPGVVSAVTRVASELSVNVVSQYLKTDENHGYMILDVERKECAALPWLHPLARCPSTVFELKDKMSKLKHTIWCRSLLRSSGEFGSDADMCFNFSGDGVGSDVFSGTGETYVADPKGKYVDLG